jgi:hypothetical protein
VKVTVDGAPLAETLIGSALPVDPGEHTFTFAGAGSALVTQTFVIKEGVKGRHEAIVLGGPVPPAPAPRAEQPASPAAPPPAASAEHGLVPPPPAEKPSAGASPWRSVGWVVGGIGVAGLGVGAVFGLQALSTKSSHCDASGTCTPPGSANDAYRQGTISTVSLVAGGVLVAGGLGLLLLAPGGERSSTSVALAVLAGPSTGGACLVGRW